MHLIRIGRGTFDLFCDILAQNQIFTSHGRKPQRHVAWQLGAFLIRYGQLGSPAQDTSFKLGIGFGTIILYCRRVTRAIRELKKQYASWFTEEHQLQTSASIKDKIGFPDCVGNGDGSFIQTSEQPSWMGPAYLSRKGFFAVSVNSNTKCTCLISHSIHYLPLSTVTCSSAHGIFDGLEASLTPEFSRTCIFGVIGTNILNMVDTSWSTKDIHPHHT
jgi:hypothetical protein